MAADSTIILKTSIDQSGVDKGLKTMKSNVDKGTSAMGAAFKKLGAIIAAAFSVVLIARFVKSSNEAYKTQIENESRLITVMRARMNATDSAIKSIQEFIKEEQKLGVVSATNMTAGSQELATYVDNVENLKTLIPIMNNIATQQYGVNVSAEQLRNTATMIGKVMDGQLGGLSRWGYSWTEAEEAILTAGTAQERAAVIADVVTRSVGDMNHALAQTDIGRQVQLKNTMEEVKAQFGEAFTQIKVLFIPALKQLASWLSYVAGIAKSVAQYISLAFGGKKKDASNNSTIANYTEAQADNLEDAVQNQTELTKEIKKTSKEAKKSLASFDEINIISENLVDNQEDITDSFTDISEDLVGTGFDLEIQEEIDTSFIENFINKVKIIFEPFTNWVKILWASVVDAFRKVDWEAIGNAFSKLWKAFKPILEKIGDLILWIWENICKPFVLWILNELIPVIALIWEKIMTIVNLLIEILAPAFEWLWNRVLKPIFEFIGDALLWTFNKLAEVLDWIILLLEDPKEAFRQLWQGIKDGASDVWDWICNIFVKVWSWMHDNVIEPVGQMFSKMWDGILIGAKYAWYGIQVGLISMVNFVINVINLMIKGILAPFNLLIDGLNLIPGVSIKKLSFSIPKISLPDPPKLAQGAVIPPNREFLAVLGDQKSGTNIETPLSTMIEAFNAALDSRGGGSGTIIIEVDGRELGRAALEHGDRERRRVGKLVVSNG